MGGIEALDEAIDAQVVRGDHGIWYCVSCPYSSPNKAYLRAHIESKHISSEGFQCSTCEKVCPTRHAMKMHLIRHKHQHIRQTTSFLAL